MWFIYVGLFILFLYFLDDLLLDKRQYQLAEVFNGPKRLPILGNILLFLNVKPKDYYGFVKGIMEKYSRTGTRVSRYWVGNQLELIIDDYRLLEKIMTNSKFISKSSQYGYLHGVLGEGLLFSTDQKWFTRRRIITPTFHFKILEQFFEVFRKHNQQLMEQIREKLVSGRPINIFPIVTSSVLNALCETAMGYEMKDKDADYLNAVREVGHIVATRFLTPWQRIDFLYNLTEGKRKQERCAKIMHEFTMTLIEERRKLLASSGEKQSLENLDDDVGLKKKMCLLDVLLQATVDNKPLTNADIQEEVDTFTFAGHDTTTNAICFTLYLISKHPEVKAKLLKEIDEVIGDDGEVTFKSLGEFKYLDLVIKETLRLYPPAPIISRRLHEEVDMGDFVAPANANYNLSLYTLFRNGEVFERPNDFVPERFMKNIPPFAFVPFSAGQRNCIGQKFALINIKNNIINILRTFDVLPGGVEPTFEINLTIKCDSMLVGFREK